MSMFVRTIAVFFCVLVTAVGVAHASVGVPEIDPGMASSALALLGCGVMILRSRFTRK